MTLLTMIHQVKGCMFDLRSLFILMNLWSITFILQNKTLRIQMGSKLAKGWTVRKYQGRIHAKIQLTLKPVALAV